MSPYLPLVSIISVNYNQPIVTGAMIESLRHQRYKNYEVIIVDNASRENPTKYLNENFPEAKVIVSDKNLGFAGGNNLGIQASNGDYLFFINNDTEVTDDLIETLLACFLKYPNLGCVSPKICYFPEKNQAKDILQYVGTTPLNPFTGRNTTIGEHEEDNNQYTTCQPSAYAHGAAMMIPRKVVEKAGLMPETFFLYYEELDWCEQIRRSGFEIYVEPNAKIYHKESLTVGSMSTLKTYYITRNRILFMRRNRSWAERIGFYIFLVFFTIPKNALLYAVKGQWEHLNVFLKAIWWNTQNTPFPANDWQQLQPRVVSYN